MVRMAKDSRTYRMPKLLKSGSRDWSLCIR